MFASFEDLTIISNGFELTDEQLPAVLGRADDATIELTNVLVSRYHCEIDVEDGQLVVRDLGSMNGTLLNDRPITTAPLRVGDVLQIGLQLFEVRAIDIPQMSAQGHWQTDDSHAAAAV